MRKLEWLNMKDRVIAAVKRLSNIVETIPAPHTKVPAATLTVLIKSTKVRDSIVVCTRMLLIAFSSA